MSEKKNPFWLCDLKVGEVVVEMNLPEAAHLKEYVDTTPVFQLLLVQTSKELKRRDDALKAGKDPSVVPEAEFEVELSVPADEISALVLLLARCTESIPEIPRRLFRGWWARRPGSDIIQAVWVYSAKHMLYYKPEIAVAMAAAQEAEPEEIKEGEDEIFVHGEDFAEDPIT